MSPPALPTRVSARRRACGAMARQARLRACGGMARQARLCACEAMAGKAGSESWLWWFDRLPRDDAGSLRRSAEDLAALRHVQPCAIRAAECDARDRRRVEFRLVENIRAASGLLADLNAHGRGGPHVTDRIDRQSGNAAEQSFFRHLHALKWFAVDQRSVGG